MKKKFLLFGALVGALLLSSCSGEVKSRLYPRKVRRNWMMPVR